MTVMIYANETETVLEALRSYKKRLDSSIGIMKIRDDVRDVDFMERMSVQSETLNRVIDRIERL